MTATSIRLAPVSTKNLAAALAVAFNPRLGELRQEYLELLLETYDGSDRREPGYLKEGTR